MGKVVPETEKTLMKSGSLSKLYPALKKVKVDLSREKPSKNVEDIRGGQSYGSKLKASASQLGEVVEVGTQGIVEEVKDLYYKEDVGAFAKRVNQEYSDKLKAFATKPLRTPKK